MGQTARQIVIERLVCGVMKGEVIHVELKTAVAPKPDQFVHFVDISGAPEGGHAHHLIFALIDLKPEKGRKGAIEQPQGVRKANLLVHLDVGSLADPKTGSGPFADAIDGEDRGLLKRGTEKRTRRMGEVVLAKEQLRVWDPEAFLDVMFDPQLVTQPRDHRLPEHAIGARKRLHIGQQEPFEFDEGLLEKDHIIQICRLDPASPQAEVNGMLRELVVVFLPC